MIVSNVPGTAVKLWVGDLPKQGRYDLIKRLAAVLDVRPMRLAREVDERRSDPANPITVKTAVHEDQVQYLYEHQSEFPGVQIQQTYLRHYRYQSLAAQIVGYVGEISADELKGRPARTTGSATRSARPGRRRRTTPTCAGARLAQIQVDSLGRPQGSVEIQREQRLGNHVRLTLDIDLQRAAERALKEGIQLARGQGEWAANGGAVVARPE